LQTQAAGGMTPALKGQFNQINRQVSRTQQSYGAQARAGSGTARTIPNRAVGGRIAAAGTEAKGAAIAESSQQAQNALLGIGQQAQAQQMQMGQQRKAMVAQILANIGSMYADYKLLEEQGLLTEELRQRRKILDKLIMDEFPASSVQGSPLPQQIGPQVPNINQPSSYWQGRFKLG